MSSINPAAWNRLASASYCSPTLAFAARRRQRRWIMKPRPGPSDDEAFIFLDRGKYSSVAAEIDPEKIAERLEQTRQARLNAQPKSYEQAAEQILRHSWEAGQISEAQYRSKLKASLEFNAKQCAEDISKKDGSQPSGEDA